MLYVALWAGTFNGLNRLNEHSPAFTVYRHNPNDANSIGHDFVLPIMEDRKGDIWFGTFGGGVSVLRQESTRSLVYKNYRHDPSPGGFRGDIVRSLLQDRSGNIWIGTDKGLNLYRPLKKSFACFPTVPPSNRNRFWAECLFESKDGTVWAGTSDLIKIDHPGEAGMTFMAYPLSKDSVKSNEIRVGIEDRHGFLWVGTEKGLVRFDRRTEAYTRYVHNPADSTSLSHNSVFSIYEDTTDSTAILWVGTGEGLNRFDMVTGKCQRYLEQEGFPSAWVYGILRDDLGRLWLSTNHGITCFDDRQPDGRKFKNYDVSDGVQGNEFNRRSYCRLRTGEFLFGGTRGVTRFHPLRMRMNPYVPPVVFTSFSKFGKKVIFDHDIAEMSSIVLAFDENDFAFDFVALNFTNPDRNRYAYMMEGFDRNWTYCGERRYAHYTHLDPGEYTFKVKASNNDGVWNEQGATVHLSITPPFWGTWWFRLISSASVVAGLFLFYRRRVYAYEKDKRTQQEFSLRLMESQENERKRIAGELHDSLGQNLLVIRNRALLGLKDAELSKQARDQLDLISSVATQAIDEVREISYDLRPYQLDRLGLTKAITSITSGLATSIQFSMSVAPIDEEVGKDMAIHVYRIVQEGINNILKHAAATEAQVVIRVEKKNIRITISDNGKGVPQESSGNTDGRRARLPDGQGFGLVGITERAKVLNGTVAMESTPGKGTTLAVIIPRSHINSPDLQVGDTKRDKKNQGL
ncbi:MAG: response regulator receiver protein [Bacteroidetes bacterium]|nr:response regulator receiver protein [Bacteroidota bacterium]